MFIEPFLQTGAAVRVSLGSLTERTGTALVAALGFAGVVMVLTGMLSIRDGFAAVMRHGGAPDIAIVLRGGSTAELNSGLAAEAVRTIAQAPGVRAVGGAPESSPEMLLVVDVPKVSTGKDSNVPFRGVTEQAFRIHDKVRIVEGRMFEPGHAEVIVGRQARSEFAGLTVGAKRRWQGFEWTVVGVFAADGGLEESEIWADDRTVQTAFKRGDYHQSVYVRLTSAADYDKFKDALSTNPQLNVAVQRYSDYLAAQVEGMELFISIAGWTVAFLMGLGAVFGAINAMYAAVSARALEIATLRALGFGRTPVVVSVLVEAMALGVVGGLFGGALSWLVFDGYQASTLNFASFSQVAFQFAVTPRLVSQGIVYALVLGFVAGLMPAVRAARQPIASALRQH